MVGDSAILVRVLPCPDVGFFRGFDQIALFVVLGVNQCDITVVLLRLFVHQFEDTFRTGQRHNDGVELLRNLSHRHGKRFGQLQERGDNADGNAAADHAGQCQRAADYRHQHIQQVADVGHDRHQNVGEGIGVFRTFAQRIVEYVKLLFALFFMAEHFDDLLATDHFLNVAVDLAQCGLLLEEEAGGLAADALNDH